MLTLLFLSFPFQKENAMQREGKEFIWCHVYTKACNTERRADEQEEQRHFFHRVPNEEKAISKKKKLAIRKKN